MLWEGQRKTRSLNIEIIKEKYEGEESDGGNEGDDND